jgi:hypothetical protein
LFSGANIIGILISSKYLIAKKLKFSPVERLFSVFDYFSGV